MIYYGSNANTIGQYSHPPNIEDAYEKEDYYNYYDSEPYGAIDRQRMEIEGEIINRIRNLFIGKNISQDTYKMIRAIIDPCVKRSDDRYDEYLNILKNIKEKDVSEYLNFILP